MASSSAASSTSPWLQRLTSILEFLIGIFGALAIIGVFFKIQGYANYEFYMTLGFMGEAAAFIIMGVFSLIAGFVGTGGEGREDASEREEAGADQRLAVQEHPQEHPEVQEVKASLRKMMEEKVNDDLNAMMDAMAQEIRRFGEEMHGMGGEMQRTRASLKKMSDELDEVASGSLADDAERLGEGMSHLGGEMQGAGQSVERVRSDLDQMAARFRQFNDLSGGAGDGSTNGRAPSSTPGAERSAA